MRYIARHTSSLNCSTSSTFENSHSHKGSFSSHQHHIYFSTHTSHIPSQWCPALSPWACEPGRSVAPTPLLHTTMLTDLDSSSAPSWSQPSWPTTSTAPPTAPTPSSTTRSSSASGGSSPCSTSCPPRSSTNSASPSSTSPWMRYLSYSASAPRLRWPRISARIAVPTP
jgi:hypothetical protein